MYVYFKYIFLYISESHDTSYFYGKGGYVFYFNFKFTY